MRKKGNSLLSLGGGRMVGVGVAEVAEVRSVDQ